MFRILYRLHKQYSPISTSSHWYYLFEATALTTVDIKMTLGHFICTVGITRMKRARQINFDTQKDVCVRASYLTNKKNRNR